LKDEERKKKVETIASNYALQAYNFQIETLNRRFGPKNVREAIELVGPIAAENFLATRGHCPEA
jgi:hypothetical protein